MANLEMHKKELDLLNKSIIALIEMGLDASAPVIDMKFKSSFNTIDVIQDRLDLEDYGSVLVQYDEITEMISVTENNICVLMTEAQQREANKYLEKITKLYTHIKDGDITDVDLPLFLSSCQGCLDKLKDDWAAVESYVSNSLDMQFVSCIRKCAELIEYRKVSVILSLVLTEGIEPAARVIAVDISPSDSVELINSMEPAARVVAADISLLDSEELIDKIEPTPGKYLMNDDAVLGVSDVICKEVSTLPKVVAPTLYLDTIVTVRRGPGVVDNVEHNHDGVVVYIAVTRGLGDPAVCISKNATLRVRGVLGVGRAHDLRAQEVTVIVARAYLGNLIYAGGGGKPRPCVELSTAVAIAV